jgi:small GTP-binding protein
MQSSHSKPKVKLLMLGDSGVGKSSILNRFTDEKFSNDFTTTLGVEYKQKSVDVKGRQVLLQIWDTAGTLTLNP